MAQFWCISPKKHKVARVLLRTAAWFPSATKAAFAHRLILASCKSKTHARPEHAFPRREWQHKPWRPGPQAKAGLCVEGLSQDRSRLLRSVRSTETECPVPRGARTTQPSPTSRAVGRAAQHSSARCWSTTGTTLVRARRRGAESKRWPCAPSPTKGMLPT